MKLYTLVRPMIVSLTCFCGALSAAASDRSSDIDALREWINTKRQVSVRELGGELSISGEVRTEFQSTTEVSNGVKQRGIGSPLCGGRQIPRNAFDIEANLMLDYRADRSWGSIKLEFDNDAGMGSGTWNKLKLERAYWGIHAIEAETYSVDVELGRRRMSSMADSKIEFGHFFDGLWVKYDRAIDSIGDVFVHAGTFIIDENKSQFAYLGELGAFNIGGTGLYTKYSLIDWDTKNQHDWIQNQRYDYVVSQLLVGYKFLSSRLDKVVQAYAAGLLNTQAHRTELTHNKRENWGSYVGVSVGELKKKGDWAFDINYQLLAAQCVPDFDAQGIGLGGANNSGFYTVKADGTGGVTTRATAGGNVNYRGFQMTLDYLLTSHINIQQSWQQAVTLHSDIGPFRRYKQYEIEFIYGF